MLMLLVPSPIRDTFPVGSSFNPCFPFRRSSDTAFSIGRIREDPLSGRLRSGETRR